MNSSVVEEFRDLINLFRLDVRNQTKFLSYPSVIESSLRGDGTSTSILANFHISISTDL